MNDTELEEIINDIVQSQKEKAKKVKTRKKVCKVCERDINEKGICFCNDVFYRD